MHVIGVLQNLSLFEIVFILSCIIYYMVNYTKMDLTLAESIDFFVYSSINILRHHVRRYINEC